MADGSAYFYSALWDLSKALWTGDTFGFTLARAGESDCTINYAKFASYSSQYVHHAEDYSYVASIPDIYTPFSNYKNLAYCTELAMEGDADAKSWSNDFFNITFRASNGTYRFACQTAGAGVFSITFNNTGSAWMYGFSGLSHTAASIYTSTYISGYLIYPSIEARSEFSREHEARNISSTAVSDSGRVQSGNARTTVPLEMEWKQPFEPIASVFTEDKTTYAFFCWQQFIDHCRQSYGFIVSTNATGNNFECHVMRESTASFNPDPVDTDNHEYWHIPFDTYFLGRYTQ